jgi:hypothetical protein
MLCVAWLLADWRRWVGGWLVAGRWWRWLVVKKTVNQKQRSPQPAEGQSDNATTRQGNTTTPIRSCLHLSFPKGKQRDTHITTSAQLSA